MAKKKTRDFATLFWSAMRGLYRKQTYIEFWLLQHRLKKATRDLQSKIDDYDRQNKENSEMISIAFKSTPKRDK